MVIDHIGEDYIKAQSLNQEYLVALINQAIKIKQIYTVQILSLDKIELENAQSSLFVESKVELYPSIELADYAGLELKVKIPEIDIDKKLEEALQDIAKSQVSFEEASDDAVIEMGDEIVLDFDGSVNNGTDEEPNWEAVMQ